MIERLRAFLAHDVATLPRLGLPMAHSGTTTLLQRALLVVVRLDAPGLPGLVDVIGFDTMAHRFGDRMQFRMHSMPLVVGVGAKFDARRWSSLLTAMTLAHRVSFRD